MVGTPARDWRPVICAMTAAALSACATPAARTPLVVVDMPQQFAQAEIAEGYAPAHWWTSFGDPALNAIAEQSLTANLDLVATTARVAAARAQLDQARAGLWPTLNAEVSGSYQNLPASGAGGGFPSGPGGGPGGAAAPGGSSERIETESWRTSLNAAYQPDLFGAVRAQAASAEAALRASRARLWAARQNALATSIEAYLDITYLRQAIRLNLTRIDLLAERSLATEQRYRRGLATSFELYGVRAQRRAAEAQLPQLEAQLLRARTALAVSLGRYAEQDDPLLTAVFRPQLSLDPPLTQAPVALLVQRPDVLAAAEELEAARLEVGGARAQLFPQLRLSAVLGTQGQDIDAALQPENWFGQLTGALTQPIFQGGALRAQLRAAKARYAAAAADFAQAALRAYGDAEAAYGAFEEARQRYLFLADQTQEAQATVRLQAERYAAGLSDYAAYLDARGDAVSAELSLAQAARDLAGARLDIHRALGGGWAPQAADDLPSADQLIERLLGPGAA